MALGHAIEYAWRHDHLNPHYFPVVASGLNVRDFALALHRQCQLSAQEKIQIRAPDPPRFRKLRGTHMLLPGDAVEVRRKFKPSAPIITPSSNNPRPDTNGPTIHAVAAEPGRGPGPIAAGAGAAAGAAAAVAPAVPAAAATASRTTAFVVRGHGRDAGVYSDNLAAAMAATLLNTGLPPRQVTRRFIGERSNGLVNGAPLAVTATAVGDTAAWAQRNWGRPGMVGVIHVCPLSRLADTLPSRARLCTDHLPWLHADLTVPRRAGAPPGHWLMAIDPGIARLRRACTLYSRAQARARLTACTVPCTPQPGPQAERVPTRQSRP